MQKTRIMIYTYRNEVYMVEGMLEMLQEGGEENEAVLELQGSIEKIEDAKVQESDIDQVRSAPTALTVYMEDKIYGFYSIYELDGNGTDEEPIIYYGYLVGYAEGDTHYSG